MSYEKALDIVMALGVLIAFALVVSAALANDDTPHTVGWPGGQGPATVCWYEAGKSLHTVCSTDGQEGPRR